MGCADEAQLEEAPSYIRSDRHLSPRIVSFNIEASTGQVSTSLHEEAATSTDVEIIRPVQRSNSTLVAEIQRLRRRDEVNQQRIRRLEREMQVASDIGAVRKVSVSPATNEVAIETEKRGQRDCRECIVSENGSEEEDAREIVIRE